jgi:hypothetical protein
VESALARASELGPHYGSSLLSILLGTTFGFLLKEGRRGDEMTEKQAEGERAASAAYSAAMDAVWATYDAVMKEARAVRAAGFLKARAIFDAAWAKAQEPSDALGDE